MYKWNIGFRINLSGYAFDLIIFTKRPFANPKFQAQADGWGSAHDKK